MGVTGREKAVFTEWKSVLAEMEKFDRLLGFLTWVVLAGIVALMSDALLTGSIRSGSSMFVGPLVVASLIAWLSGELSMNRSVSALVGQGNEVVLPDGRGATFVKMRALRLYFVTEDGPQTVGPDDISAALTRTPNRKR